MRATKAQTWPTSRREPIEFKRKSNRVAATPQPEEQPMAIGRATLSRRDHEPSFDIALTDLLTANDCSLSMAPNMGRPLIVFPRRRLSALNL